MARRLSILLLATAASACTCAPTPGWNRGGGPETTIHAPEQALHGRVVLPARADGTLPPVEVRVVPEAAAIEAVSARLKEARAALARLADAREAARRETRAAVEQNDRTEQEWRRTMSSDLRSRVELVLRRPRDPQEVRAAHAELQARKAASYEKASAAAKVALEKERALAAQEEEARPYREPRYFVDGLPPATAVARSDGGGRFAMDVPPGRYALVALAEAAPGGPGASASWLLWIEVRDGVDAPLVLDAHNRHGTDCEACVVSVKELP